MKIFTSHKSLGLFAIRGYVDLCNLIPSTHLASAGDFSCGIPSGTDLFPSEHVLTSDPQM